MTRGTRPFILSLMAVLFFSVGRSWALDTPVAATASTPTKPWKDTAQLSYVSTNGNSRGTTTSGQNTLDYNFTKATLEIIGGGLGASSGKTVTSEQYNASEKMTYPLSLDKKNYVYESGAWDKNRFAGYNNRWDGELGYGRQILAISSHTLVGEFGEGYINEERIDAPRNDFASSRAFTKYAYVISATAQFTQTVEFIYDDSDHRDYRLNTETALIASVSSHLSLKVSYDWHRVGRPPAEVGKDDTITSAALIINY